MKKYISVLLCLAMMLSVFVLSASAEDAKVATDDTTGLENFWTLKGAAVRISDAEAAKLRFETTFEKEYLDGLIAEYGKNHVHIGTVVTSLNNLKRADRVFTMEALEATEIEDAYRISYASVDHPLYVTDDTYVFAGYSEEILNYTSEYAAIGFVEIKGEVTYSQTYTSASPAVVAKKAMADTSSARNQTYSYPVIVNNWGNPSRFSRLSPRQTLLLMRFYPSANQNRVWSMAPKMTDDHIRVVSSNVYFHCFKTMKNEEEKMARVNLLTNTLASTGADVLLLQEVSGGVIVSYDFKWQERLCPALEKLGYTMVDVELDTFANSALMMGNRPNVNYTPIFYNAERLELKDCGHNFYDSVDLNPDSYLSSSKSYTWALFEEKATGKQFIAISTHLTYHGDATKANQLRVQDAEELDDLKQRLEDEYMGVPMILMGDLNCTASSDPYRVLEDAGFRTAKNMARFSLNGDFRTSHGVGSAPEKGNAIDHVLVGGELHVQVYQTYLSQNVFNMSDHIPVGIDFTLDY